MRTEQEMMELILDFAKEDSRVRLVTLEGSRANKNIPRDTFQDFDISYFVTNIDSFKKNDDWLSFFGKRLMMQKPEDMELFPPELGGWYSYLMLFQDGNRLDLKLIPLEDVEDYFSTSDGLVKVILDKDRLVKTNVNPSDEQYWIKRPTAREFDDCCNEFWWVSTYVVKGLARKEILYAIDHLNWHVRPNLLRMLAWKVGLEKGFTFSIGKNYKYIEHCLPKEDWKLLMSTYSQVNYAKVWESLFTCYKLFRKYSKTVAEDLTYQYPNYDKAISEYTQQIFHTWA